jgi:heme-degrading monooxygenase HmoA
MTHNLIHDTADWSGDGAGEVILVNIFTPKPGQTDAFIEAQTAEYRRLKGKVAGWKGNHLHKSLDGATAVNIATFDSIVSYRLWRESALFADHVEVISPFVAKAQPSLFGPALYESNAHREVN